MARSANAVLYIYIYIYMYIYIYTPLPLLHSPSGPAKQEDSVLLFVPCNMLRSTNESIRSVLKNVKHAED